MYDRFNSIRIKLAHLIPPSLQKHLKHGAPFLCLVLGGSLVLSRMGRWRYDFRQTEYLNEKQVEELKKSNITIKPQSELTLEKLHEEYLKKDLAEDYKNVRGPRPWEAPDPDSEFEIKRRNNKRFNKPVKSAESYNIK